MEKNIRIGWAQTDITPDRPIYVIGQLYSRISSYVHDPLTATCLVLENGQEQMILVSADMPGVPTMHPHPGAAGRAGAGPQPRRIQRDPHAQLHHVYEKYHV